MVAERACGWQWSGEVHDVTVMDDPEALHHRGIVVGHNTRTRSGGELTQRLVIAIHAFEVEEDQKGRSIVISS
jgi:hypothetical protein